MLGKAGMDANPEMKIKVARFSGKLCTSIGKRAGGVMKLTIDALVTNLSH